MKKVTLTKFLHRDQEQLGIAFAYDDEIREHVKQMPQVLWSNTHKLFIFLFQRRTNNGYIAICEK
ncbi:hypothetical protein [Maribacter halichondriae]|uniref:hypothetical protein n=1 Tax=Maribacter halichondriae TaxID=2980554 RepID=UPI002358F024|nr:hypothetical protein [Maribacter sp. Hal144]